MSAPPPPPVPATRFGRNPAMQPANRGGNGLASGKFLVERRVLPFFSRPHQLSLPYKGPIATQTNRAVAGCGLRAAKRSHLSPRLGCRHVEGAGEAYLRFDYA